jgi:hypothetical protein
MLDIIKYIKTFFNTKDNIKIDVKDEKTLQLYEQGHEGSTIDYTIVKDPVIVDNKKLYNFIIVDDEPMVKMLLNLVFDDMAKEKNFNVNDYFNVIWCIDTEESSYMADKLINYITNNETYYKINNRPIKKIDVALLDLTIEYRIRLGNGQVYSLDGIDIYSKLLKHNPDIKVRFFTAHTIGKNPESNIKSEMMTSDKYIVKYKNLTGLDLVDVSIPKLHVEDAPDSIIKLLKSFLDTVSD